MKSQLAIDVARLIMAIVGFYGLLFIWIPKDPSYAKVAGIVLAATFLLYVGAEFWALRQAIEGLRAEIKGESAVRKVDGR